MNALKAARSRHKTLRVQADVPHTFGTLLIPLALILVAWGIFLVERTVANPLESDFSGILFGSVVLACGLMLVSYLIRAVRISAIAREKNLPTEQPKPQPVVRRVSQAPRAASSARPVDHVYVDHVRISL